MSQLVTPGLKSAGGQRIIDSMDKERFILNVEKHKGLYDTMILFYMGNMRNVYYRIISVIMAHQTITCTAVFR